jgi:2-dehydropantoate 2-reductase
MDADAANPITIGQRFSARTSMRIGIVGAGAIGGLIGVQLARSGHDVSVLARGATLEALRTGLWSLELGGEHLEARVSAAERADELGAQEILLIAVKGPSLAAVAREIGPLISAETVVIPAMNGVPWWFLLAGAGGLPPRSLRSVDPDGAIARAIPFENLLGCVVHASARASAPATVVHHAGNKLIFGEPASGSSKRLNRMTQIFAEAGIESVQSANIRRDIWYKLWGNMTMNPISAITRATSDQILDDELVRGFMVRVMGEAARIGSCIGCEIRERGEDRIEVARQLGSFKTSMLQDAEAGRPLEIDQIVAAPQEIARLAGVSTPNLDTLLGLARLHARRHGIH